MTLSPHITAINDKIFVGLCERNPTHQLPLAGTSSLDINLDGCTYGCNPVNLATGDKLAHAVDYRNHSPYPIVIDRHYNSRAGKWMFSHERSAEITRNISGEVVEVVLWRPDHAEISFRRSSALDPFESVAGNVQTSLEVVTDVAGDTVRYLNRHDETEVYDEDGKLIELLDGAGRSIDFTYDTSGRLVQIADDFGRQLTLAYQLVTSIQEHHLSSITDGDITVLYEHTGILVPGTHAVYKRALLSEVTYGDGKSLTYLYDENMASAEGRLTGILDETGLRYATYEYNPSNGVMQRTEHGGGVSGVNYWITPGLDTYVSQDGSMLATYFDHLKTASGGPVLGKTEGSNTPCLVCGGTSAKEVTYGTRGNPSSKVDFNGVTIQYTHDTTDERALPLSASRTSLTDGWTTSYTWDTDWRLPLTITETVEVEGVAATRTTTFTYNSQNLPQSKTVSMDNGEPSRVWGWTYNTEGQVLTHTDPENNTTTYTYDTSGNLASVTNAESQTVTLSNYNPRGLVGKMVDANGLETHLTYDDRDRVVEVKMGSPSTHWETVDVTYTPFGAVERVDYPDGSWVEFEYDQAQRRVRTDTPLGSEVLTLDSLGNVLTRSYRDPLNQVVQSESFTYDMEGRMAERIDALNNTRSFGYTWPAGQPSVETDETSVSTYYVYDALGRLERWAKPMGPYWFGYDADDELSWVENAYGQRTSYVDNGFGEVLEVVSPETGTTTWTRDSNGQEETITDARGVTTTIQRDGLGRVLSRTSAGTGFTTQTETYTYDSCQNGVGRLCSVTDPSGSWTLKYDLWGREVERAFTPSTNSLITLTTTYTYNAQGQRTSMVTPGGTTWTYTYLDGQVVEVEEGITTVLDGVSYHPAGHVEGWAWGHSLGTVVISRDANGRVESIQDEDTRDYVHDARGSLIGITDSNDPTKDQVYDFDDNLRLTEADLGGYPYAFEFVWDPRDNWDTRTDGTTGNLEYYSTEWTSNRMTDFWFTPTWSYDAAGNMVADTAGLALTYDARNRMDSAVIGSGTPAWYTYNPWGQRVIKQSGTVPSLVTTYLLYDDGGRPLGVYDSLGLPVEEYVHLDGFRVVGVKRGLSLYRVLTDHLGTPRKVMNPLGDVVWTWDAKEAFGNEAPNEQPPGQLTAFVFDLRFPGQRFDEHSGLFYNGFRDYHPGLGRYVQSDPIGLAGGMNTYGYAGGNPLQAVDPYGLFGTIFEEYLLFRVPLAHEYGTPREKASSTGSGSIVVCDMASPWCSAQRAYEASKHAPYPRDGRMDPIKDGAIGEVRQFGALIGKVWTEFDEASCRITNSTLEGHWFHEGRAERYFFEEDGKVYEGRYGAGKNNGYLSLWANELLWQPGFNALTEDLKMNMRHTWLNDEHPRQ